MKTPEQLIRATFKDETFFEVKCLPGRSLCLDAADVNDDLSDLAEFSKALGLFMGLTPESLLEATPYLYAEFKDYESSVDPSYLDTVVSRDLDIWNELDFTCVNVVRRRYGDRGVYVQLAAECSWDPEHGIQLIYREGSSLSRVSEQDGHYTHCDAFGLPETNDRIR